MQKIAVAVWDYEAKDPSELTFKVDDHIVVLEERRNGWWKGKMGDQVGDFPVNYCDILGDEPVGPEPCMLIDTGVRIDQEKISSGILSLQKRCGFIVDLDEGSEGTGSSQEEQNKALHSGNLSFDEVVKKVGGAAFNPLAGRITHKRHLSASSILTPQETQGLLEELENDDGCGQSDEELQEDEEVVDMEESMEMSYNYYHEPLDISYDFSNMEPGIADVDTSSQYEDEFCHYNVDGSDSRSGSMIIRRDSGSESESGSIVIIRDTTENGMISSANIPSNESNNSSTVRKEVISAEKPVKKVKRNPQEKEKPKREKKGSVIRRKEADERGKDKVGTRIIETAKKEVEDIQREEERKEDRERTKTTVDTRSQKRRTSGGTPVEEKDKSKDIPDRLKEEKDKEEREKLEQRDKEKREKEQMEIMEKERKGDRDKANLKDRSKGRDKKEREKEKKLPRLSRGYSTRGRESLAKVEKDNKEKKEKDDKEKKKEEIENEKEKEEKETKGRDAKERNPKAKPVRTVSESRLPRRTQLQAKLEVSQPAPRKLAVVTTTPVVTPSSSALRSAEEKKLPKTKPDVPVVSSLQSINLMSISADTVPSPTTPSSKTPTSPSVSPSEDSLPSTPKRALRFAEPEKETKQKEKGLEGEREETKKVKENANKKGPSQTTPQGKTSSEISSEVLLAITLQSGGTAAAATAGVISDSKRRTSELSESDSRVRARRSATSSSSSGSASSSVTRHRKSKSGVSLDLQKTILRDREREKKDVIDVAGPKEQEARSDKRERKTEAINEAKAAEEYQPNSKEEKAPASEERDKEKKEKAKEETRGRTGSLKETESKEEVPTKKPLKPVSSAKISKRWLKKVKMHGGNGDVMQSIQRLLLSQLHGQGNPVFKQLKDVLHDLEIAQKNEDQDCLIVILGAMLLAHEAHSKEREVLLEQEREKRKEVEKELTEERSKTKQAGNTEKELRKLMLAMQEEVAEKSKVAALAQSETRKHKQKSEEETEKAAQVEKELKKQYLKLASAEKELRNLEQEVNRLKGKNEKERKRGSSVSLKSKEACTKGVRSESESPPPQAVPKFERRSSFSGGTPPGLQPGTFNISLDSWDVHRAPIELIEDKHQKKRLSKEKKKNNN